jgi:hypothetical protein
MGIILGDENDVNTVPCNSAIPNLELLPMRLGQGDTADYRPRAGKPLPSTAERAGTELDGKVTEPEIDKVPLILL